MQFIHHQPKNINHKRTNKDIERDTATQGSEQLKDKQKDDDQIEYLYCCTMSKIIKNICYHGGQIY